MDWVWLGPAVGLMAAWFAALILGARLVVACAIAGLALAALALRVIVVSSPSDPTEMWWDLAAVAAWALIQAVVLVPLWVSVVRSRLGPPTAFRGVVSDDLPESVLEADDELIHLNFRPIGFILPEGKGLEELEPVLLSGDNLTAARIVPWKAGARSGCHVQFGSHRGARRAATGNWTSPPLTPLPPGVHVRHVFNLTDLPELYRAHARHCIEALGGPPDPLNEAEVVPRMIASLRRHMDLLKDEGWMEVGAGGSVYRFTSKGRSRFFRGLLCMQRRKGSILSARGPDAPADSSDL